MHSVAHNQRYHIHLIEGWTMSYLANKAFTETLTQNCSYFLVIVPFSLQGSAPLGGGSRREYGKMYIDKFGSRRGDYWTVNYEGIRLGSFHPYFIVCWVWGYFCFVQCRHFGILIYCLYTEFVIVCWTANQIGLCTWKIT